MNEAARWALVNRLRASIANGHAADYPQAANDIRMALHLLDHYKRDSDFLRAEKSRAWAFVNADDSARTIEQRLLVFGAVLLIVLAVIVIVLGLRIHP